MKKFILIAVAFLFMALGANAQTATMTGSGDTVVNAGTKACSLKVVNTYKQITIQTVITKISGTVAGTVTLQGTLDGVTWVTCDTATFVTEGAATYTATNVASQSKIWVMRDAPYLWYRVSWTGSGTMSATLRGYLLPRTQQ